jgi:hypothetical protein
VVAQPDTQDVMDHLRGAREPDEGEPAAGGRDVAGRRDERAAEAEDVSSKLDKLLQRDLGRHRVLIALCMVVAWAVVSVVVYVELTGSPHQPTVASRTLAWLFPLVTGVMVGVILVLGHLAGVRIREGLRDADEALRSIERVTDPSLSFLVLDDLLDRLLTRVTRAVHGDVAVIDLVRRIAGEVPPSKRWRVTALSAGLATLMAAGALVAGGAGSRAVLSWQLGMNGHVASRDVAVIQTLGALLRPGSIVLNDGVADDGRWITALTDDVEAEPKPHTDLYPNDWRLVAMAEACTDPAQAERALAGVQAVFVGSDPAPGAAHVWRASCIAALPDVHLVAGTAEGPAGFVVTGGSAG